ncbi:MAG TPA: extracellular solute-binding protein [Stellaceae bacterium]|nr:extracellular solute-binding protein [Stellaceae bacterium]
MKRAILAAAAMLAAVGVTGAAEAQAVKPPMSPELQKIVDGAKTEKVMLSSTNPLVFGGQANIDAAKKWIKDTFGVDLDFNVTNGGPFGIVGAKIATEFRAGQPSSVDLWAAGIAQYAPLLKSNMFVEVPWRKLWPDRVVAEQIGADGYSLVFATGTPGVLYNTQTGKDFAEVKTIDDLLKPQYKGRFGTTAFANGFDAMSAKGWEGEAKMIDYITKLGHQAQGILNCGGQDRVASGEFQALVLDCVGGEPNVEPYIGKLALDVPADAAQLQTYELLIPKNAQHPNAAILFALYLQTTQGQEGMHKGLGADLDLYPETVMHKFVADHEASGIKFRRIDWQFWKDNPGIDVSGAKLGKALKEAIGG